MASQVSSTYISNMALRHLGHTKPIQEIETDSSEEAVACRTFYDISVEEALRDFAWPFATRIETLGLVATDPNDEWGYSYRYPSDCMMFQRILSGTRNDTRQSKVPYKIGQDNQGKLIFTDKENAQAEFTRLEENVHMFPRDLVIAISFLLANYIAPSVTKGGDVAKLGDRALNSYAAWIEKARANSLNEGQSEEPPESEFIRARGGAE